MERTRYALGLMAVVLGVWLHPLGARADGILGPAVLTTGASGAYLNLSNGDNQQYSDPNSGTSSPLSLSSNGSLLYPSINISSQAAGTVNATPVPSAFHYLQVSLSATAQNFNVDSSTVNSSAAASSEYTASFTLGATQFYTLSLTANSSVLYLLEGSPVFDPGFGSATLSLGNQVLASVGSYSDLNSSDGLQTLSQSGVLGPGTYFINVTANANSALGPDHGATNATLDGSGSASFELTLTPVPEPASISLLALGLVGMAGYFGRRRYRRILSA